MIVWSSAATLTTYFIHYLIIPSGVHHSFLQKINTSTITATFESSILMPWQPIAWPTTVIATNRTMRTHWHTDGVSFAVCWIVWNGRLDEHCVNWPSLIRMSGEILFRNEANHWTVLGKLYKKKMWNKMKMKCFRRLLKMVQFWLPTIGMHFMCCLHFFETVTFVCYYFLTVKDRHHRWIGA